MKRTLLLCVILLIAWSKPVSQSVISEPNSLLNFHDNPVLPAQTTGERGLKKSISTETEDSQRILYPDTKWSVLISHIYGWPPDYTVNYWIDGDTIIDATNYYKVFREDRLYACLREENMKLYAHFPFLGISNDMLLYDFNPWTVGGSYQYEMVDSYPEKLTMEISRLDTIILDDGNCFQMANKNIINSIGSISGILEVFFPSPTTEEHQTECKLKTYYRNGIQLYDMNKHYLSLDIVKKEDLHVYVDANGLLVFTIKSNDIAGIEEILIYSVNGQLEKTLHSGTKNLLTTYGLQKGIYFYQVKYAETNKTDCGKIIIK